MKALSSALRFRRKVLVTVLAASVVVALAAAANASAATERSKREKVERWQKSIQDLPVPSKGCFQASYPQVRWQQAACKAAPDHPYPYAQGPRPQTVGGFPGNTDFSAETFRVMSSATGSVPSVSAGATEKGIQNGTGAPVANTFSLQLNANRFSTALCKGGGAACEGWQQFIYSTTENRVFIQYWLINHTFPCPTGWKEAKGKPGVSASGCFMNSSKEELPGGLKVSELEEVKFTGSANVSGNDTVVLATSSKATAVAQAGNTLNLGESWKVVEFAVVGDCCSSQAEFSKGTTIRVNTQPHSLSPTPPSCVQTSFTAETNNLNLVGTPRLPTEAHSAIGSTQGPPGTAASCAKASGFGGFHLITFGGSHVGPFRGLLYDFQASGDFDLATTGPPAPSPPLDTSSDQMLATGPEFDVQARQVSAAPRFPNASFTQAVAAHIGATSVAVCTAPTRLEINGQLVALVNGSQLNLSDGGDVTRDGNVYLFRGANGDSVRARVNAGTPSWIDVSVGLGRWPFTVHGLLANAGDSVNTLESRLGGLFTAPFAFNQIYGTYGESWRVSAQQSLLSPCGESVATGNPKGLIYANNLPANLQRAARSVCLDKGVKAAPLLDACTVDVAVFHTKAAATVYRTLPADVTTGKITLPSEQTTKGTCGNTTVGKTSHLLSANVKRVNACKFPVNAVVSQLVEYLTPTSHSGQQLIKGIVYADDKGKPGALLGVTEQLTFKSTNGAGWYAMAFKTPLKLAAGKYWIGTITGPTGHVAAERTRVKEVEDANINTYTSGPSNPFGSFKQADEQVSLYAVYTAA